MNTDQMTITLKKKQWTKFKKLTKPLNEESTDWKENNHAKFQDDFMLYGTDIKK